ncbi:MAG TPA: ImmA/IrrE family metallo-endopeptidase [Pirellulales bacterium]|nr:ImmA/IrrE family metallo-endopeptidase [Pirellulales bacterium]
MAMEWTNSSVQRLSANADPIATIQNSARQLVLDAIEQGWVGPPFDPFDLAHILNVRVVPSQEVLNASLTPEGRTGYRIDYNPNQSRRRIRFSIAHEIAHTLFPDCRDLVRNRVSRAEMREDEWQLEMLCNIAAAEILMPAEKLPIDSLSRVSIDDVVHLQEKFDVSVEALLLRIVRLERKHCAVFVASPHEDRYHLDYAVESHGAEFKLKSGLLIPETTRLANCAALGYTAKGDESWVKEQTFHVESVAIPSYPGHQHPRVAGILYRKGDRGEAVSSMSYVVGDATKPHGTGQRVVAQVVNDGAARWGGAGFASAIRRQWPTVQSDFLDWVQSDPKRLRLGNTHNARVDDSTVVFSIVAQHGYGASRLPRIRYQHLKSGLVELRDFALSLSASVHIPRIGCGEAGGNWLIVEDLIRECLSDYDVHVTVYDLHQQSKSRAPEQQSLFMNF